MQRLLWLLLGLAIPLPAPAETRENPAPEAQIQCRLLLRAADPAWPPDNAQLLAITGQEALFGPEGDHAAADEWRFMTGSLPDFGFLLGHAWDAVPLADRKHFNRAAARFVLRAHEILPVEDYAESCDMAVSTSLAPESEQTAGMPEEMYLFPQPPVWRAIAVTEVETSRRRHDERRIKLVYVMDKREDHPWQLKDILVDNRSLAASYASSLQFTLRDKGMIGAIEMLSIP